MAKIRKKPQFVAAASVNNAQGRWSSRASAALAGATVANDPQSVALVATSTVTGELGESVARLFPFATFNAMQSQCLEAWYGDGSMVVSAPTGSGKTAVFDLAVLRVVVGWRSGSGCGGPPPVAVYVAPTKALVRERVRAWRAGLAGLATVVEVSSDGGGAGGGSFHSMLDRGVRSSERAIVVVATPEKWEMYTRKRSATVCRLEERLVLAMLDEVHMVGDSGRGAVLEVVVSRFKMCGGACGRGVRFVAASATIPNVGEVGAWLGVSSSGVLAFPASYRPVPLELVVLGTRVGNRSGFMFERSLNYRVFEVLMAHGQRRRVSAGGGMLPTLIFCSSRSGAAATAKHLVTHDLGSGGVLAGGARGAAQRAALDAAAERVGSAALGAVLPLGVGFHNAGLSASDRATVEALFLSSELPILCSTTTLALGVNLPAATVVIKSTQRYVGGAYAEYSAMEMLQMVGRAGRPGFAVQGESATAVVLTANENVGRYRRLETGHMALVSQLEARLPEVINTEIVLGRIRDEASGEAWLQSTFFHVSQLASGASAGYDSVVAPCVAELAKAGLVRVCGDGRVEACPGGRFMSAFGMRFATMVQFDGLGGESGMEEVLAALSQARELEEVLLRRNEKRVLAKLNLARASSGDELPHPLVTRKRGQSGGRGRRERTIRSEADKVNVLWQAALSGVKIEAPGLAQEAHRLVQIGARLSRALVQVLVLKLGRGGGRAVLVAKSFKAGLWHSSGLGARQLDGVGIQLARKLREAGLGGVAEVAAAVPGRLESVCTRRAPFGAKLRSQAAALVEGHRVRVQARVSALRSGTGLAGWAIELVAEWPGWAVGSDAKATLLAGIVETNDVVVLEAVQGNERVVSVTYSVDEAAAAGAGSGSKMTMAVSFISHEVVGVDADIRVPLGVMPGARSESAGGSMGRELHVQRRRKRVTAEVGEGSRASKRVKSGGKGDAGSSEGRHSFRHSFQVPAMPRGLREMVRAPPPTRAHPAAMRSVPR
ncbi:ATP-dependent DNA helicase MER3 [Thecamonas trahens ATCC 50062]|uniref:ATP-dependent DNA helicase MER3 n=1 Tax=Thecamonas trahens ATCC 50062 TaxID=461836 RepID=A0A0L0DNL3_THETB|nr:ATP-dependent DNA helicase MER3 [Thecamonas trahens ATCC 50062]KNC53899.1 ATP-dependent DNA helicase MER3 [Thecamonas trahens ATCC 50062]|eukprot:XP_013754272.1 ATP-dependent DNA helicase MER3 [Thecamonas trahens ATCC 50062]